MKPENAIQVHAPADGDEEALEQDAIRRIPGDRAWYWYRTAPYEGHGTIIVELPPVWLVADLGHCSCYGPCDKPDWKKFDSFEALERDFVGNESDNFMIQVIKNEVKP